MEEQVNVLLRKNRPSEMASGVFAWKTIKEEKNER
jgi:hypothetical protein